MNTGSRVRVIRECVDDRFFHRYCFFNNIKFGKDMVTNAVGTVDYDNGGFGICVIWNDKRMPELIPRQYIEEF